MAGKGQMVRELGEGKQNLDKDQYAGLKVLAQRK